MVDDAEARYPGPPVPADKDDPESPESPEQRWLTRDGPRRHLHPGSYAGRHSALTERPEVAKIIIDALGKGLPHRAACALAEVPYGTFRDWLSRGEGNDEKPPSEPFKSFAIAVRRAEATSEGNIINRMWESGQHDWRMWAWYLAKRHPESWSNQGVAEAQASAGGDGPSAIILAIGVRNMQSRAMDRVDRYMDVETIVEDDPPQGFCTPEHETDDDDE